MNMKINLRSIERMAEGQVRFWTLVEITPSCWIWHGTVDGNGYGVTSYTGGHYQAHQLPYVFGGWTPKRTMPLHHVCLNRRCVRPHSEHVFPVTPSGHSSIHARIRRDTKRKEWFKDG